MWTKVKSIKFNRIDKFYDTNVPEYHNYIGNGILNHNSGKDSISAIAMTRMIYVLLSYKNPQLYFGGLDKTSPIDFVNIARSSHQAKNVYFMYLKNMVKKKSFWKYFGEPDILQQAIRFPKNITCYSGHSKGESLEGYSPFMYILDEISAFPGIDELKVSSKNLRGSITSAEYIDGILNSSMTSRFPNTGIGILLSYPRYQNDPIQQAYNAGLKESYTYVDKGSTWEVNLSKKKEDFKKDFDKNNEDAMAKYCCEPMAIESAYIKDKQAILEMFDPYRDNPIVDLEANKYKDFFKPLGTIYSIHVDLALTKDSCGFVMGHLGDSIVKHKCGRCGVYTKKGDKTCLNCGASETDFKEEHLPTVEIDLIEKISPPHKGEIEISDIVKKIVHLKDTGFNLFVTFDQYQSASSIQILKSNKIDAERISVDRTPEAYETLKELIYDRRIQAYEHDDLKTELEWIIFDGKKVDHLPNKSKDIADALAGVCFNLIKKGKRMYNLQNTEGVRPILLDCNWYKD